jgi:hypothetical protein
MNLDILWDVDYDCCWANNLCEYVNEITLLKIMMDSYLTIEDIRSRNNYELRLAYNNGYLEIVEFLMSRGLLNEDDIRSEDNYDLRWDCYKNGHLEIVEFLEDWIKSHSD